MHQLFSIEYLVNEICSHASYHELPSLARVSSIWFRCAIPRLYKEVDIEEALAPLGVTIPEDVFDDDDETLELLPVPNDKNFERFSKYSPYVRSLTINLDTIGITFMAVRKSVSKGFPYLFLNLHDLDWAVRRDYSSAFMKVSVGLLSPKIERLSLNIRNDRILHDLGPVIMACLPALHFISVSDSPWLDRTGVGQSQFAGPVQDLLTFYAHTLTSVEIPLSLNTESIVERLSNMPNLCNLAIGDTEMENLKLKRTEVQGGIGERFPSLHSFSFDGAFQSLHDMFLMPYGLASLTILSLNVRSPTSADVRIIISFIAMSCPHLRSLNLGAQSSIEPSTSYVWTVVPWSSIQPISRCKKLTALTLNMMRISVNIDELTEFLKSRATWTCLHLLASNPLHLKDILLYAKHCPDLEHLGIHISDRHSLPFCIEDLRAMVDISTFSSLISIDFGGSYITSYSLYPFAQLLHRICKKPLHYIRGLGDRTNDLVSRLLAIHYLNEEYRTGKPISHEVRLFVAMVLLGRTRIDDLWE